MALDQNAVPAMPSIIRSPLVRTVYNKILEDRTEQQRDHSCWYEVDRQCLPSDLRDKFVQFHEDVETQTFLDNCYKKSDWMFKQLYFLVAKSVLSWFMTNTSVNGFLKRGSMFVFSQAQFQSLLHIDPDWKTEKLLDLGAGDGMVTKKMEPHFEEIYTTEASTPMRWRLQEQGYRILEIDEWSSAGRPYDVISCLNLLDRCDRPLNILAEIRKSLRPRTGRALVAVVLPFGPYVEFGNSSNHMPEQRLHISGNCFEEYVASFAADVFEPLGFSVESFSRVPYLCEGDLEHSFYVLDDAVFVLKVADGFS